MEPLEDARGFSETKFGTTLAEVRQSIPSSHELVFYYCSQSSAEHALRAGVPGSKDYGGVVFSLEGAGCMCVAAWS